MEDEKKKRGIGSTETDAEVALASEGEEPGPHEQRS